MNDSVNNYKKINENLISWYPFDKNSNILIISLDNETNFINKNNYNIININVKENEKYIDFLNIEFQFKFDYIIMVGTYEYSPLFIKDKNPYVSILKYLKNLTNEKGKIIFTIDNKFGVKYFVGAKSNHYEKIFDSLIKNCDNTQSNLLSKEEILRNIKNADFEYYKFYYPVPNYITLNAIFTDDFLPKPSNSKLIYPLLYDENSIVLYNEIELIKQLSANHLFDKFCNSFLVELSKKNDINDIKFVSYNNLRKNKYNSQLIINGVESIKTPIYDIGIEHINNIKKNIIKLKKLGFNILEYVEDNKIKSNYIKNKQLDHLIYQFIISDKLNEAFKEIERWYEYIKRKLIFNISNKDNYEKNIFELLEIEVDIELINSMNIIENGFIDLSFENTFLDENKNYIFYDQEWFFKNVPVEFILYRALNNLFCYNNLITKYIEFDKILEHFNLIQYKDIFLKLEKKIQWLILDENKVKEQVSLIPHIYNIENIQKENEEIKEKINLLKNDNEILKNKYQKLENEYNAIINSEWYKVIKHVKKFFKGKK